MLAPLKHYYGKGSRSAFAFIYRRRFQLVGGLLVAAFLPLIVRLVFAPTTGAEPSSLNALACNMLAIALVFWARLTVETFPGVRSSHVILPAALAAHGAIFTLLLLTRLPYDRPALAAGFVSDVVWNYAVYFFVQRTQALAIGIVPIGDVDKLYEIDTVEWVPIGRPERGIHHGLNAIVADFGAELPGRWETYLTDAALEGTVVYQVNQLYESLTGRVEVRHLSENSFGSLVPMRAYAAIKYFADFALAIAVLPIALPLMAAVALLIKASDDGPIFFRQKRVGLSGNEFLVWKFRTMRCAETETLCADYATTKENDPRITKIGAVLRRTRLDELPQIINILRGEMSWIGPRPEAKALGSLYQNKIPFYRYRHVVKPGISGWAQVNQGHVAAVDEVYVKLQYDFFYIKYFSLWLDILIVFRTIKTLFNGFGSK